MRLEIDIAEHHYNNIMALDSVSLGRVPYKGIIMYSINAIKHGRVLDQEPITKNDLGVDCISRKAALDITWHDPSYSDPLNVLTEVRDKIRELPSVTPQPRKGHWKLVQRGKFVDVCCSNCEAVRIKEYAYNYTIDQLNKEDINECFGSAEMRYCPNCGSRNEVENDTD